MLHLQCIPAATPSEATTTSDTRGSGPSGILNMYKIISVALVDSHYYKIINVYLHPVCREC